VREKPGRYFVEARNTPEGQWFRPDHLFNVWTKHQYEDQAKEQLEQLSKIPLVEMGVVRLRVRCDVPSGEQPKEEPSAPTKHPSLIAAARIARGAQLPGRPKGQAQGDAGERRGPSRRRKPKKAG